MLPSLTFKRICLPLSLLKLYILVNANIFLICTCCWGIFCFPCLVIQAMLWKGSWSPCVAVWQLIFGFVTVLSSCIPGSCNVVLTSEDIDQMVTPQHSVLFPRSTSLWESRREESCLMALWSPRAGDSREMAVTCCLQEGECWSLQFTKAFFERRHEGSSVTNSSILLMWLWRTSWAWPKSHLLSFRLAFSFTQFPSLKPFVYLKIITQSLWLFPGRAPFVSPEVPPPLNSSLVSPIKEKQWWWSDLNTVLFICSH